MTTNESGMVWVSNKRIEGLMQEILTEREERLRLANELALLTAQLEQAKKAVVAEMKRASEIKHRETNLRDAVADLEEEVERYKLREQLR
jgi:ABC-type phosphate transport system auxiliary subunit